MVQRKPGYDPFVDAALGYYALRHAFNVSGVPLGLTGDAFDYAYKLIRFSKSSKGAVMEELSYLQWLVKHTPTTWWHDSGDPDEFAFGLSHGASGVTTNPVLTSQALHAQPAYWRSHIEPYHERETRSKKWKRLMRSVALPLASRTSLVHTSTQGAPGIRLCTGESC